MNSTIIKEILEIKDQVKKQGFVWNEGQRVRYDNLMILRREQIKDWTANGKVWVGPSNAGAAKSSN